MGQQRRPRACDLWSEPAAAAAPEPTAALAVPDLEPATESAVPALGPVTELDVLNLISAGIRDSEINQLTGAMESLGRES